MTEEHNDIITMADMAAVFDVTDAFSIDRESISVDLTKEDPGAISASASGEIEITLPLTAPLVLFMSKLRGRLIGMGYTEE
jgi:hypothetical protein